MFGITLVGNNWLQFLPNFHIFVVIWVCSISRKLISNLHFSIKWVNRGHHRTTCSVYPMTSSENSLTPIRWSLILFGFGVPRRVQLWNRRFGLFPGYPIMSWYFIWIQGSFRKRYIIFRIYKSFLSHEDGLWDPLSCEEQDSNIQNKMYFWNLSSCEEENSYPKHEIFFLVAESFNFSNGFYWWVKFIYFFNKRNYKVQESHRTLFDCFT